MKKTMPNSAMAIISSASFSASNANVRGLSAAGRRVYSRGAKSVASPHMANAAPEQIRVIRLPAPRKESFPDRRSMPRKRLWKDDVASAGDPSRVRKNAIAPPQNSRKARCVGVIHSWPAT